jgi:integrase/recombinase XerD
MRQDFSLIANHRRVEDFLTELQLADGLARTSLAAMRHDLRQLERFSGRELVALTEPDLHAFVAHLNGRGVRNAAMSRQISSLRRFYRWAAREGACADIAAKLRAPRVPPPFPKALPPRRTRQLLETRPDTLSARELLRNQAMLELAYGSGLRAAEVCALRTQWLDLGGAVVKVLGKGSKERVVPLSEPCVDALRLYLEQARPAYLAGRRATDAVFVTRLGRAMSPRSFLDVVKKTARAAGLPLGQVSPHVLRHSFATDLVDGGADLRVVQMLLGHESITTTTIYLRTSRARLQELIAKHHPRG